VFDIALVNYFGDCMIELYTYKIWLG
jgi:hypothetical protein